MNTFRRLGALLFSLAAILICGCASNQIKVAIPARMDLTRFATIGVIQFASATEGELAKKATQRFIEAVQKAQPGLLILELGTKDELLRSLGMSTLDADAVKALKDKKSVDAVFFADLTVSDVKAEISIKNLSLSGISGETKVEGELAVKLWHTPTGAVAWSDSAAGEWTLGKASSSGVRINDPEEKYYQMVDDLVYETTRDFRPTYEMRDAPPK